MNGVGDFEKTPPIIPLLAYDSLPCSMLLMMVLLVMCVNMMPLTLDSTDVCCELTSD